MSSIQGADANVARDIAQYLATLKAGSCALDRIGAGGIIDTDDYTWSCVNIGERAAEAISFVTISNFWGFGGL